MTKPMVLAAGAGIILALALIAIEGPALVLGTFVGLGFGAVWITLVRCLQVAGAGWAWWVLLAEGGRRLLGACIGLRWIRESINTLLPVAQVGGDIIGARLLTAWRIDGGRAGASVLVDLLVQTATQVVFAIVGVILLARLGGEPAMIFWMSIGLGVLTLGVVGFFIAQRFGGFHLVERALVKLADNPRWSAFGGVANLHQGLQAIHDRRRGVAVAALIHLVAWFIGALEIWIALDFMGHNVNYMEALAIESLGQAVRAAGFLIPGALGVQEGGFVAICAVLGIPAPLAIALSLAKRVPEIILGLPGLIAWQVLEGRMGVTTAKHNDVNPS